MEGQEESKKQLGYYTDYTFPICVKHVRDNYSPRSRRCLATDYT